MKTSFSKLFSIDVDNKYTPLKLAIIVFVLWVVTGIILYVYVGDWSTRGQFGDMFGTINALFSGLAFAGIIYTILLQREELGAQREELKLTRDELKQQNKTLKQQAFEVTFFNLLKAHREMANKVTTTAMDGAYIKGIGAFAHIHTKLKVALEELTDPNPPVETLQNIYTNTVKNSFDSISPYLISLNAVLQFIERSAITQEEKSFYYSLIGARMLTSEIDYLYCYTKFSPSRQDIRDRVKNVIDHWIT